MQRLALLMIVAVTIVPYLAAGDMFGRFGFLPGQAKYIPELIGGAALLYVVALGIKERFRFVRPAYWIILGFLALSVAASVVANGVEPGPLFSGIRGYLRAMPWFFVPAVFAFTEKHLQTQFLWLLAICVLQVPLAIEQRIYTAGNYFGFVAVTGDWTTGTLMQSGFLSIFLVAAACVVAALTLRQMLPKGRGLLLFLLLLVPTMINETKVTLIVLPIGLMLTFLAAARPGERLKQMVFATGALAVFLAAFIPTYNWLMEGREYGFTVTEFFTERIDEYLDTDSEIGAVKTAGRVDSARVTVRETLQDPVRAVFGLGIGNTLESALGPQFSGKYYERYRNFTSTGFASMILQLGFLGFGLLMCVYWLIFRDAWFVARHGSGRAAALAAAWAGVTPFMALTLFYTNVEVSVALSFLFWYCSGLVAAERVRLTATSLSEGRAKRDSSVEHDAISIGARNAHA
jgi:hypothetical protein